MIIKDIDINIPYSIYCLLPEEQKFEVDFLVQYSNLEDKDYFCEIPLEERSFGFVKELMSAFIENDTIEIANLIFSLKEYDEKIISSAPAWKSIKTMQYIANKVNELILVENQMLTPQVQDNKYKGFIEQIDFSVFSQEYTQVRELAHNDITKFEEIRKLPYKSCLIELIYLQKQNDLDRLIMKSTK